MKKSVPVGIVIGIILVIAALGYIGDVFEVWDFTFFFPGWWTLFLIVPAAVGLIMNGYSLMYVVWLVIGGLLLVNRLGIVPEMLADLMWPLLVLALGAAFIFRGQLSGMSTDSYIAIFGGRAPNFVGKRVEGGFATAIFGGVTLRMTEAQIVDGAKIDAIAIFGGVDVFVPSNVNVEVSGLPIFGGISEPKKRVHIDGAPTLRVTGIAIFGGVDVK